MQSTIHDHMENELLSHNELHSHNELQETMQFSFVLSTHLHNPILMQDSSKADAYDKTQKKIINSMHAMEKNKQFGETQFLSWSSFIGFMQYGEQQVRGKKKKEKEMQWNVRRKQVESMHAEFLTLLRMIQGIDEAVSENMTAALAGLVYAVLVDCAFDLKIASKLIFKRTRLNVPAKTLEKIAEKVKCLHDWKLGVAREMLQEDSEVDNDEEFGKELKIVVRRKKLPRFESKLDIEVPKISEQVPVPGKIQTIYDFEWLNLLLLNYASNPQQFATKVVNIIHSQNEANAQEMLLDLLGMEAIEAIGEIVTNINELKQNTIFFLDLGVPDVRAQNSVVSMSTNKFSITTTQQKQEIKLNEKEQKKFGKIMREQMIFLEDLPKASAFDQQKLSAQASVFVSGHLEYNAASNKTILPVGAKKQICDDYDMITIPPLPPPEEKHKIDLIPVSSLDPIIQSCFQEKFLNRIQTICYPAAYKSNENLLVCAPTGAGKTNVALLTILRELVQHEDLNQVDFKIVYVAPMKALAQEIAAKFSSKLHSLGVVVKEFTGDMQLSKSEIMKTHIIVTTPEKWDVVTRKAGEGALSSTVRLLIVDEVHLLHEERGAVIETIIARTLRLVESSQSMIRIVGISATLPNYLDVARFLHVNPDTGLLSFDSSYRPVPLEQVFIGCKGSSVLKRKQSMNDICYQRVLEALSNDYQVMVFVHSRRDTVQTAKFIREQLREDGKMGLVDCQEMTEYQFGLMALNHSRNDELSELYRDGFGFHNAGMTRPDRNFVEKYFSNGCIRLLVCTATLAWGVNLPAHTVIIKGTEIYDSKAGGYIELSMLDVMQIFGRAGRPQFDMSGEACLITSHEKLDHYLYLLTHSLPIESTLAQSLENHLNAEIVGGSVTNLREAVTWLSYTYLYVRMLKNPLVYGLGWDDVLLDPTLLGKREKLIQDAALVLHKSRMIRFDPVSGNFGTTDLGRVASFYYIHHQSIEIFNEKMKPFMTDEEIIDLISRSKEFTQLKFREEEMSELLSLKERYCPHEVRGDYASSEHAKTCILLQVYISNVKLESFTLISDQLYISQNAGRIARCLFEIALKRGLTTLSARLLDFCLMIDHRVWDTQHPLRQFPNCKAEWGMKLDHSHLSIEKIREMTASDVGIFLNLNTPIGVEIKRMAAQFPLVELNCSVQPITRTILQITLNLTPQFRYASSFHGTGEPFWIWVEDADGEKIYHYEFMTITKNQLNETLELKFTVPVPDPPPAQYIIVAASDRWLGARVTHSVSFQHLIMPEARPPTTQLLNLNPLPLSVLGNAIYQDLYKGKFTHFNPVQTQAFHTLYHTDHNVLLGAPTGSGKTIIAEISMFRLFNEYPDKKVVYIAPLKALARERVADWSELLAKKLNRRIVELTGDFTPDMLALKSADIIITTPEKWDGISRDWQQRSYVKKVGLVIIDEIHLLGTDRGPVLEIIVSRMRYIADHMQSLVRIVGLSTALANAGDLADWLGIKQAGLFNFPPTVRPVPLTVHISGFPGKHYCPRMATMNKPTYAAITTYSPTKPVLVFVSSRRQTRLTAMDLISFTAADSNPRKWLKVDADIMDAIISDIQDEPLRHCLTFGVGIHHAGLKDNDRKLVERLFVDQQIQILVCTSTLAWGVNFPAHLVVVKGTEYFDAKTHRYIDYPVTDVLQMMGRAGRPQFDSEGRACILVHEPKKLFYRKFLYEPFPVESSLHLHLHDHMNAEIVGKSIKSVQDAVDFISWTYYFRRLIQNPSYYNLPSNSPVDIDNHLNVLIKEVFADLKKAGCITFDEDEAVAPTPLGRIGSFFYLKYGTVALFNERIVKGLTLKNLLFLLSSALEFIEFPVRHNEELINEELATQVRYPVDKSTYDSPHTKVNLLVQCHLSHIPMPISDYTTDTKSVLDQTLRVINSMVEVASEKKLIDVCLNLLNLMQMIVQGQWNDENAILNLPFFTPALLRNLGDHFSIPNIDLPKLMSIPFHKILSFLKMHKFDEKKIAALETVLLHYPIIHIKFKPPIHAVPTQSVSFPLQIFLKRASGTKSVRAIAPRFPKPKEESFWLVIGHEDILLFIKRVCLLHDSFEVSLNFQIPALCGVLRFKLYFICDSYLGLDQDFSFEINVTS